MTTPRPDSNRARRNRRPRAQPCQAAHRLTMPVYRRASPGAEVTIAAEGPRVVNVSASFTRLPFRSQTVGVESTLFAQPSDTAACLASEDEMHDDRAVVGRGLR